MHLFIDGRCLPVYVLLSISSVPQVEHFVRSTTLVIICEKYICVPVGGRGEERAVAWNSQHMKSVCPVKLLFTVRLRSALFVKQIRRLFATKQQNCWRWNRQCAIVWRRRQRFRLQLSKWTSRTRRIVCWKLSKKYSHWLRNSTNRNRHSSFTGQTGKKM